MADIFDEFEAEIDNQYVKLSDKGHRFSKENKIYIRVGIDVSILAFKSLCSKEFSQEDILERGLNLLETNEELKNTSDINQAIAKAYVLGYTDSRISKLKNA